jgi:hypothetical protein
VSRLPLHRAVGSGDDTFLRFVAVLTGTAYKVWVQQWDDLPNTAVYDFPHVMVYKGVNQTEPTGTSWVARMAFSVP